MIDSDKWVQFKHDAKMLAILHGADCHITLEGLQLMIDELDGRAGAYDPVEQTSQALAKVTSVYSKGKHD